MPEKLINAGWPVEQLILLSILLIVSPTFCMLINKKVKMHIFTMKKINIII